MSTKRTKLKAAVTALVVAASFATRPAAAEGLQLYALSVLPAGPVSRVLSRARAASSASSAGETVAEKVWRLRQYQREPRSTPMVAGIEVNTASMTSKASGAGTQIDVKR